MSWADAIQNNILRVEFAMLVVQILAFVSLLFYVRYTRDLKKSAENQIKLSQDLLRAALEQVEGAARPCITLASKLRNRDETISELYGVKGGSVVKDYKGFLALRNIGNGLALNISYRFNEAGLDGPKDLKGDRGYLQRLHAEKEIRLPLPISMTARGEWDVTFEFESLGSRRYRTTLLLQANILSNFKFEQLSDPLRVISADTPYIRSPF
jgi:hypothetical protein